MFDRDEIETAASLVHKWMDPTPQIAWPLLEAETGARVWVKHENHTPIGAFKIRGGITFVDWLQRAHKGVSGIVSATRGNHGQSIACAARNAGLKAKIVVPKGNSVEKNAAMRAQGAELIEYGGDFDEARPEADRIARIENLFFVPPFHRELVRGVATYGLELFKAAGSLDAVFVPIGCGSGVCAMIAVRDALGLETEIIGVVSENAPTAKLSAQAGKPVETNSARTFADGVAVRVPVPEALEVYAKGASRIVEVSEQDIAGAIRLYFRATHNLAEGAGAAALAALMNEREEFAGKNVGVILSGGNIDVEVFRQVIAGEVPAVP